MSLNITVEGDLFGFSEEYLELNLIQKIIVFFFSFSLQLQLQGFASMNLLYFDPQVGISFNKSFCVSTAANTSEKYL